LHLHQVQILLHDVKLQGIVVRIAADLLLKVPVVHRALWLPIVATKLRLLRRVGDAAGPERLVLVEPKHMAVVEQRALPKLLRDLLDWHLPLKVRHGEVLLRPSDLDLLALLMQPACVFLIIVST